MVVAKIARPNITTISGSTIIGDNSGMEGVEFGVDVGCDVGLEVGLEVGLLVGLEVGEGGVGVGEEFRTITTEWLLWEYPSVIIHASPWSKTLYVTSCPSNDTLRFEATGRRIFGMQT